MLVFQWVSGPGSALAPAAAFFPPFELAPRICANLDASRGKSLIFNASRQLPAFPRYSRVCHLILRVTEGYTLYSSHVRWRSEEDFVNWTKSDHFRAAHRNAGDTPVAYKGPPVFEGFTVVEGA